MKGARLIAAAAVALVGMALSAIAQAPTSIGPPVQIMPPKAIRPAKPKPAVREKKPAAKAPAAKTPAARAPAPKAPAAKAPPSTVFGEPTDRPPTVADIPSSDPNMPYAAFQAGRFLTAFATATRRVEEKGDPKAMTLLGELYAEGHGVPHDDAKAVAWYSLAADRGDPEAMFALAMF